MSALVTSSNGLGPACLLSLGSKTLPQDKIGLEIEARDVQVTTLLGPGLVSHLIGWYWASQDKLEKGYPTSNKPTRLYEQDENDYGIPEVSDGHGGWGRERDNNLTRWTQNFYDGDECDGNEKIRAS